MPSSPADSAFEPDLFALAPALLQDLLAVSLTAVNLLRPVYGPDGALVDFTIEYLNPAAQRMTGLAERPRIGVRARFPDVDANGIFAMYRRVFETGEAERLALNYQADGLDNYFHVAARRSGELLLVSFTDTAEQPRTAVEVALRASQAAERDARTAAEAQHQQLSEVLQQAPVAMALLDGPDYRITLANPAVCEIWARPPEQLLGKPLLAAMPELQGQGVDDLLNRVLRSGQPFFGTELPFRLLRYGRLETIYFNFVYQPQRNDAWETTGVLVVASDVTEIVANRQRVEAQESETAMLNEELAAANEEIRANNDELTYSQQELRLLNQDLESRVEQRTHALQQARAHTEQQRQQFEQLFMQAPAAICIFGGPEWVYELVNPRYQQLFPGRKLLGRPLLEALPEVADQPLMEILRGVYDTGVPFEGREVLVALARYEDGPVEDIYFDLTYHPRFDKDGRIDGFVTYANDVTAQVRAREQVQGLNAQLAAINAELQARNQELDASNQQLLRTNIDLDNFIYTASHDLKAPISNIEGLLYLLREELPAEVASSGYVGPALTRMLVAVERFKRTIDHLTEVSKLQKEHTPVATAVDLAEVADDVRLDLLPVLQATNAQLQVQVAGQPPVLFSEKNLRSVVFNLLSNALKYRHPDRRPHVDVRAHAVPGYTVLEVHDNGLGIAPAHLPRLFGMFQRFHDHVEGTGIGLYMVKRMVENAGGRLTVHSEPGAGSTFFVYLPHTSA